MSFEHKNNQEQEFNLLLNKFNEKLNKVKFDLENGGEYIIKEHCIEIRRQVQLAKEQILLKIEEIAEELIKKIDLFESDSLEAVSTTNNDIITCKLNELKSENDKWNKCLNEYKIDSELVNDLRDSISKLAIERENINQLLFNSQLLEFEPIKMEQVTIGTLSNVVIDSFEHKIEISKHIESLKNLGDNCLYLGYNIEYCSFFSSGDFVLYGYIPEAYGSSETTVICAIDLGKNELKIIKKNSFFKVEQLVSCSDKICASFHTEYNINDELVDEMEIKLRDEKMSSNSKKYVVLDQNFDLLHRTNVVKNGVLEAASDSYLIFSQDPNPKQEHENCLFFLYNWSLQFVRAIGKSTDIIQKPDLNFKHCFHFFNEIYYSDKIENRYCLKVFDDYSGNIVKTISLNHQNFEGLIKSSLMLDCNNNLTIFKGAKNLIDYDYYNFSGDFILKRKIKDISYNKVHLISNLAFFAFDDIKDSYFIYYQKKLDESNYTVKSEFR
jgi:hypothetical protein